MIEKKVKIKKGIRAKDSMIAYVSQLLLSKANEFKPSFFGRKYISTEKLTYSQIRLQRTLRDHLYLFVITVNIFVVRKLFGTKNINGPE